MINLKETFKKYNIKPKKYLGQNFLINENILKDILKTAHLKKNDILLEIGAGNGILTERAAKKVKKIIAIEKDQKMIKILKDKFSKTKNVEIVNKDILKCNIQNLIQKYHSQSEIPQRRDKTKYKVIGNLPYYITSPIIKKLIGEQNKPKSITLMVQKEVGQRICAKPPKMSILAITTQLHSIPKNVKIVKKENFWPKPKVDSMILQIKPIKRGSEQLINNDKFFKIVQTGFSSRRKQLKNNLNKMFKQETEKILKKAKINPTCRAETLLAKDWIKIYNIVK